jgi:hypothetical protein
MISRSLIDEVREPDIGDAPSEYEDAPRGGSRAGRRAPATTNLNPLQKMSGARDDDSTGIIAAKRRAHEANSVFPPVP